MACEDLKEAYENLEDAWSEAVDDLIITGGLALGSSLLAGAAWASVGGTWGTTYVVAGGATTVAGTQIYNHTDKWGDFLTIDEAYDAAQEAYCDCLEKNK